MSNRIPHKVSHYISISSLAVFLSGTLLAHYSHAQEVISNPIYVTADEPETSLVEQFVRQGQRSYQQKDMQEALNYFARALLLDTANKPARESMALINAQVSLPAFRRIQLFLAEDLLAINENLREKLNDFTARRDTLAKALPGENYTTELIERKFRDIQSRFTFSANAPLGNAASPDALEALNKFLLLERQRLLQKLSCVNEQFSWLQQIHRSLQEKMITKTKEDRAADIATAEPPRRGKAVQPAEPLEQIAGVREELNELRLQIKDLQEDVKSKDERITGLTRQVIEFALKLAEREMILSEKISALSSLHESYADLQSRLELGQKIFEEKNAQIQSLQEGLAALQADTAIHSKEINNLIAAKDNALDEWEKILAIYQGELKDTTQRVDAKDNDIAVLQQQLASVSTKLFEKETALEKTKQKLAGLEKQFQAVVSETK